jgi:hypothetical protein
VETFVVIAVIVFLWVLYMNKRHSPANAKKMKEAHEKEARVKLEAKKRWEEEQRLQTTIVATKLLGESAAEYKKSVGSMAARGAVGSLFGPAGAVIGMASAKNENVNKDKRRFLVKYLDGHIEEKEVKKGSEKYEEYMKYLVWDE